MKTHKTILLITILTIFILLLTACDSVDSLSLSGGDEALQASGVIEATEVIVAPELGGRVTEVLVQKGEIVSAGQVLFRLEDDILSAQYDQAVAAVDAAQANLEAANAGHELAIASLDAATAGVDVAEAQYELELTAAREAELATREETWNADSPDEFDLPSWYFEKTEQIEAARSEISAASEALETEFENYQSVLEDASNADILAAEERLAEAQAAFLVAEALLDRDIGQDGREQIEDYVQTLYDSAEAELEAAQLDYDQMLSEQAAEDVLDARARLSVARERYEIALDQLSAFFTGSEAFSVRAAAAVLAQAEANVTQTEAAIDQAATGVTQAEKALVQAEANLEIAELQMDKLTVYAAVDGVILSRSIEEGELIRAGAPTMTIGKLDELTVKVYIPENRYGEIKLGEVATLKVDSFPDEDFEAVVIRIADKAEYTPRNVQTQEDRATTVYAIELSVDDPDGKLKPGMPADVTFDE